jgi:D-aspartate ligase
MKLKHTTIACKHHEKTPAFVLGSYLTSGLGDLGLHHIPVYLFDPNPHQLAFYSKYCHGIRCPHPQHHEQQYIDLLIQIGEQQDTPPVLIPTSDTDIRAILKHKNQLQKHYLFPLADLKITDKLLDKKKFYNLLKANNLPHPKTFFPGPQHQVTDIAETIMYPSILKPVFSSYFRINFNTKVFVVKNKHELLDAYQRATTAHHNMVLQEIIPGDASHNYGFNTYYDKQGSPQGGFMYQRIRTWPPLFGNGCSIQQVHKPELESTITPLIKKIQYFGIVDVEFKKDPRDNTFKLIEINPRAWMQHSLATRCGYNFAYYSYLDALGKEISILTHSEQGVKWVYMFDDIPAAYYLIRTHQLTLKEWITSLRGPKSYAIFRLNDPLPFLKLMPKTVPYLWKKRPR